MRGRAQHGVLTFAQRSNRGGVLGDDLRQMSGLKRLMLTVAVLGAAVGLGWLAMKIAAGL